LGTAVALAAEALDLTDFLPGYRPDLDPDTVAVDSGQEKRTVKKRDPK
jgi:hypothetical protein